MKSTKKVAGFTLIEIVIVIAIMGVVSAAVYSSFDKSKAKSRDQKRVSDISAIQLSLEQYFNRKGYYPTSLTELVTPTDPKDPKFLSEIPKDPVSNQPYTNNYFPMTRTQYSDKCITYQLWVQFEQTNQYIDIKKGFNSKNLPQPPSPKALYECGNGHSTVDASPDGSLIYDVMP